MFWDVIWGKERRRHYGWKVASEEGAIASEGQLNDQVTKIAKKSKNKMWIKNLNVMVHKSSKNKVYFICNRL